MVLAVLDFLEPLKDQINLQAIEFTKIDVDLSCLSQFGLAGIEFSANFAEDEQQLIAMQTLIKNWQAIVASWGIHNELDYQIEPWEFIALKDLVTIWQTAQVGGLAFRYDFQTKQLAFNYQFMHTPAQKFALNQWDQVRPKFEQLMRQLYKSDTHWPRTNLFSPCHCAHYHTNNNQKISNEKGE